MDVQFNCDIDIANSLGYFFRIPNDVTILIRDSPYIRNVRCKNIFSSYTIRTKCAARTAERQPQTSAANAYYIPLKLEQIHAELEKKSCQ